MIANALPPKWIVSRIYTLKEGNAPDGRPIRDLFLEMTTAEAQFYNDLTDDKPFLVNSVDLDGNVTSIIAHGGEVKNTTSLRDHGWEIACVFPADVRGFFDELSANKVDALEPYDENPPLKEEKELTPEDVGSTLHPDLFKKISGLWTVTLYPTALGLELGMPTYSDIDNWNKSIDKDVEKQRNNAKLQLKEKRKDLERQLKETKHLLSTFA